MTEYQLIALVYLGLGIILLWVGMSAPAWHKINWMLRIVLGTWMVCFWPLLLALWAITFYYKKTQQL